MQFIRERRRHNRQLASPAFNHNPGQRPSNLQCSRIRNCKRPRQNGCGQGWTVPVPEPPTMTLKGWFLETKEWFFDSLFIDRRGLVNNSSSGLHWGFPLVSSSKWRAKVSGLRFIDVGQLHVPPPVPCCEVTAVTGDGTRAQTSAERKSQPLTDTESESENGTELLPQPASSPPASGTEAQSAIIDGRKSQQYLKRGSSFTVAVGTPSQVGGVANQHETLPTLPEDLKPKDQDDFYANYTFLKYGSYSGSRCCPRSQTQRKGFIPCIPAQCKSQICRGFALCFTCTAGSCLCLSNCLAKLSFCLKNCARTVEAMATTAVDVKELPNSYVFVADMPGLKHSEIKVQVENDSVLKISGERRRDDFATDTEIKYVRVERSAGKFMRKFNLPANANLDGITAACQDGLLTVIVPKNPPPDPHRPRTFDVNVGSASVPPP
ncbi:hypothetical protein R1sor_024850 [Riccia sorocarpa]|uniref:SHSP domain-containing protein n=1 Tax=Riccia sorocarpa TaxID=122646 RepID=A0ABD3GVM9_9MARC